MTEFLKFAAVVASCFWRFARADLNRLAIMPEDPWGQLSVVSQILRLEVDPCSNLPVLQNYHEVRFLFYRKPFTLFM